MDHTKSYVIKIVRYSKTNKDIEIVQKEKDKINLININNVVSDINLQKTCDNGVGIIWKSNNISIVDNNGKVTRPEATQGDTTVTLTAIFTKGTVSETKDFLLTIKAKEFTDNQLVERGLKNLQLQEKLNSIMDNLQLPTRDDVNNLDIVWESNNKNVISNTGNVTRLDKDINVTLTATLKKGSVLKTKKFDLVVKAKEKDITKELELIGNSIKLPSEVGDEQDIELKNSIDGSVIRWNSNNEDVISNTGKITRPKLGNPDIDVNLTATISKDGKSITKKFTLKVKSQKELIAKNKQELDEIIKKSIIDVKSSVSIYLPNYKSNQNDYNFDNYTDLVTQIGEMDFGKPTISGSVTSTQNKSIMTIKFDYKKDVDTIKKQKEESIAVSKQIVKSVIKSGMSPVEKELALHDYIVKIAEYNEQNYNDNKFELEDHNAYGVLVKHIGVCESYAKAMNLLLKEAGIDCKYITGYSKKNGVKGGGHAWNMVKLDNEWYNLDITWDDPAFGNSGNSSNKEIDDWSPVIHSYFNVPDSIFNDDHIREKFEEENYPKCKSTKYSYENINIDEYAMNGKKIEKVTSREELDKKIKDTLNKKGSILSLRIKGFKMTQDELQNEVKMIANKNNLGEFTWVTSKPDENHIVYSINWTK